MTKHSGTSRSSTEILACCVFAVFACLQQAGNGVDFRLPLGNSGAWRPRRSLAGFKMKVSSEETWMKAARSGFRMPTAGSAMAIPDAGGWKLKAGKGEGLSRSEQDPPLLESQKSGRAAGHNLRARRDCQRQSLASPCPMALSLVPV